MSFVKWGVELKPTEFPKGELTISGVPVKSYVDMARDRADLIRVVRQLIQCVDVSAGNASIVSDAESLLARMGESND